MSVTMSCDDKMTRLLSFYGMDALFQNGIKVALVHLKGESWHCQVNFQKFSK